jgi:hypothetical protein
MGDMNIMKSKVALSIKMDGGEVMIRDSLSLHVCMTYIYI